MMRLSDKQERFCKEYIIDLNVFAAMVRAGYSESYAKGRGYEMLENVGIQNRISELKKARADKQEIDAEWVLKRLVIQVESNVLDAFSTANGLEGLTLENLKALPRELQMCIKKIRQTRDGIEVQFEDRQRALEMIGRHIGFFEADNKYTIDFEESPVNSMPAEKAKEFAQLMFNGH